jgi:PAS domain S-box-containing protein
MGLAYLLDSIINAEVGGGGVRRQLVSPGCREFAVRLAFLSVLLLFIAYVSHRMLKRKHLEKALVKYQAGMDASIDGIFILDSRQQCAYLNRSQARLHGYDDHAEVLGKSWRLFYADDEIRRFEEEVFPVIFAKGEWRGEAVGRRRDGTTFPQEISFTAVDRSSIVCIVRDITDHKSFERELECKAEELAAANRELEAFSYSLTHDMRSYLTRSFSAAQLLQEDYHGALDESGRYLVKVVCNANEDMDMLIKDMMILSRIVRSEISRETIDLSETAHGIASVLMLAAPDRRAEFAIAPDMVATGDPQLLKVALDNLIGNAWKYTGMMPEVRIEFGSVARDGKRAFFVRDNGMGFDMKDADKLFEPFQRLENAKDFPGTGIGLATVQRIIRRHGGEVWGEGEQGKGAAFFFTLPE